MKIIPLFGGATASKSPVVTRQRRLNVYYDNRPDGDKTKVAVYGTPGLVTSFTLSTPSSLPLRGFSGEQSHMYAVAYNQFYKLNSSGSVLTTNSLATYSGNVSIAAASTQAVVVDGVNGYLYTDSSGTLTTISPWQATGAQTCTFVGGFFVAEQPGTQKFWVSNAYDGSTWNALAFASASTDPGNILAVDNLNTNLVLFFEQGTEFWQNVGASPEPFQPILSAGNEFGLAAINSRAHVNQTLIYLAQTREGAVQVVQLNGYSPNVISDGDIESIINGFSTVSDAVALTYQVDTHKMYQLTFPNANRSFLYDTSTGIWSEVQTGTSVTPTRHWGQLSAYCNGVTFISDYATSKIYKMSNTAYTDAGSQTIVREIITRHILSDFNRIRISLLYLDMETGVGLQTGQGSNPQIMLQYSKDNGRTWSAERWVSSGLVGDYMARVIWRRFGSTRDATFRIRMSDPVKFVITEGSIKLSGRAQ